jgi:Zn ribbon nucleic-acid-binding protein
MWIDWELKIWYCHNCGFEHKARQKDMDRFEKYRARLK